MKLLTQTLSTIAIADKTHCVGAERAQHIAAKENMETKTNQENIFISFHSKCAANTK